MGHDYPSPSPVPVSASGAREVPKDAVCTGLRIRPSANGGYTVTHSYEAKEKASGKGPSSYRYIPDRDYTFESKASMLKHVERAFDGEKD